MFSSSQVRETLCSVCVHLRYFEMKGREGRCCRWSAGVDTN